MSEISIPEGALTFPITASDEAFLEGVKTWVDLLSQERYAEAYRLTAHESYYGWTPDLIRSVIAGYGDPHEPGDHEYKITKICEAQGGPLPRWEVDRWEIPDQPERIAFASCDLPLDGEWSDLTATFEVIQNVDHLVLVLQEIHVF